MVRSFGSRLREQRQQQQVALADIAEETKIKASLLDALERDDLSQWPTGLFRRSYLRAYARAIGLDPDATLREFLAIYPEPEEELSPLVEANAAGDASKRRPPTRLGVLISSALGALPSRRVAAPPVRSTNTPQVHVEHVDQVEHADDVEDAFVAAGAAAVLELATADDRPAGAPPSRIELPAVADLCARLARAADAADVAAVLADAVRVLDAVGLIVWHWDVRAGMLRAVLSHGYPDDLIARLPLVPRDAPNAIAAAFRAAETRVIDGGAQPGAIVVPLSTPRRCAGVLALELRSGGEDSDAVRAAATILAAQLSTLVGDASPAESATA